MTMLVLVQLRASLSNEQATQRTYCATECGCRDRVPALFASTCQVSEWYVRQQPTQWFSLSGVWLFVPHWALMTQSACCQPQGLPTLHLSHLLLWLMLLLLQLQLALAPV